MADSKLVKALGEWAAPTVERHKAHVAACEVYEIEPEPFERFADEVMNTPRENRGWLLADEPIGNYEPFVRFAQYQSPIAAEQSLSNFGSPYRREKK